jgi:hypothetical protein
MAVYYQSHTTGFNDNAIGAVAGKRIRVRRLIVSSAVNTSFTLKQDVGGPDQADVSPAFQVRNGSAGVNYRFPREAPEAAPGKALGYMTDGIGNYGVWIEYDLVD